MAALIRIASRPRRALALSTTAAYLDERVRDPQLKAVLASQWGDYGLPPSESAFAIHTLVVASYLGGGYYPIGGAGTIARSVAEIVAAHGGQCLVDHRVAEIIVSDGAAAGVRVESTGRQDADLEFTAPHVVSDAGAFTTFCHLVPQRIPIRSGPILHGWLPVMAL